MQSFYEFKRADTVATFDGASHTEQVLVTVADGENSSSPKGGLHYGIPFFFPS